MLTKPKPDLQRLRQQRRRKGLCALCGNPAKSYRCRECIEKKPKRSLPEIEEDHESEAKPRSVIPDLPSLQTPGGLRAKMFVESLRVETEWEAGD